MPLVRARYASRFTPWVDALGIACAEIVPAAFNTKEGHLTPGSIEFIADPAGSRDQLTVDVLLEVEAFRFDDRVKVLEQSCLDIRDALKYLFPDHTFAVWGKLVEAGWASDSSDPEFDGDMRLGAAIQRAEAAIKT